MTISEKIKNLNKKKVIRGLSIFGGFGLIIIVTLFNLIWSGFDFNTWALDTLVLVVIIVAFVLFGESMGADSQSEDLDGLYQRELESYGLVLEQAKPKTIYLDQYISEEAKRELREKKISFLKEKHIDALDAELIIDNVKKEDLAKLFARKDDFGRHIYTKEQTEAIEYAFSGKISVHYPSANYYCSALDDFAYEGKLEAKDRFDSLQAFNKSSNRALKIGSMILTSAFWAGVTVKELISGQSDAEAIQTWFKLASRLFAAVGSIFSGFMTAVTDVKLSAMRIADKRSFLEQYLSAIRYGEFVPKTNSETAKAEFLKWIEKGEEPKEIEKS